MSSHKPGESEVTDELVIRRVLPRNGPKLLALLMDVPIDTAKWWYYRHLSAARRKAVALALLEQMDDDDRRRTELRTYLVKMAGTDEVGSSGGGLADAAAERLDTAARALTKWAAK